MNEAIILNFIIILLIALLFRTFPLILGWIEINSGDVIFHLLCAEKIRENKFKIPYKIKGCLLPGIYDYPPLFHWLLALFSQKKRESISPLISPFFDLIHILIISAFTLYILNSMGHPLIEVSLPIASTAALLFASSPALLYYGIGPRSYSATPRTLSELFAATTFFLAAVYYNEGSIIFLCYACIFSALTLLTNKFGGQVIIFFSIGLAIILRLPQFLLLPLIGILLALLLSNGFYKAVVIGWFKHSLLLKNIIIDRHPIINSRNRTALFGQAKAYLLKSDFSGFIRALYHISINNTYAILIFRNLLLILLLINLISKVTDVLYNKFELFLVSWIIISLIAFFATSLRPFLFLGESERYVEYSVPAQAILFPLLNLSEYLLIILLILNIIFYILNLLIIKKTFKMHQEESHKISDLLNWFNEKGIHDKRILTIHVEPYLLVYRTNNYVLWPPGNFTEISVNMFKSLWEEFGWPNKNLKRIIENYDIDLIAVDKKGLNYALTKGWKYNLSAYKNIYDNGYYSVYEIV